MTAQNFAGRAPATTFDRIAVSRIAAIAAAIAFGTMGLILVSIGAAFPMALTVIDQMNVHVSASDLAVAQRLAPTWPIFAAAAVANVVAMFGVLDRRGLGSRIALVVAGTGLALAFTAQAAMAVVGASLGDAVDVAGVVAYVYLATLMAVIVAGRRQA